MIYDILLLLSIIAIISTYIYVKKTYKIYSNIELEEQYGGFEIARKILNENKQENIYIIEKKGFLLDYLDLKNNALYLCKENFEGENISSFVFSAYYALNIYSYKLRLITNILSNGILIGIALSLFSKNIQMYNNMILLLTLLMILKIFICINNYKKTKKILKLCKKKEIKDAIKMIYVEPIYEMINNLIENVKMII